MTTYQWSCDRGVYPGVVEGLSPQLTPGWHVVILITPLITGTFRTPHIFLILQADNNPAAVERILPYLSLSCNPQN